MAIETLVQFFDALDKLRPIFATAKNNLDNESQTWKEVNSLSRDKLIEMGLSEKKADFYIKLFTLMQTTIDNINEVESEL